MLNHLEMERYVAATAKRADMQVQWEQIEAPRTNGKVIYLPAMAANIDAYGYKRLRHFVTHEVDHNLYTDFHNDVSLKGVNAASSLLGAIWNITEDHRIEFLGTEEYEGDRLCSNDVYGDMIEQMAIALKKRPDPTLADTFLPIAAWSNKAWADYYPSAHLVQDSIEKRMSPIAKGYYDKLLAGDYLDVLRNIRQIADRKEGTQATLELSRRIFEEVYKGDASKEEQRCQALAKAKAKGGEGGEAKKGEAGKEQGEGAAGDGKAQEGEGKRDQREGPPINVDYTEVIREPHVPPGISKLGKHLDYRHFTGTNKYTPPTAADFKVSDLTSTMSSHAGYYQPAIQAALASTSSGFAHRVRTILQIRDRDKYQYGTKRGKLHNSALHRVLVKDVPGYNERIFKRKQVNDVLNAAITLIVDQSGSMGGDKFAHAAAAATMLSETVGNILHIPTEILSFSNEHDKTTIYLHRKFSDKLVSRDDLVRRFGHAAEQGMNGNADGEAVLWAYDRIAQRKEKRKLIVMFSDGSPACGMRGDDVYYTKKVVKEIEKDTPVSIVGVGIMDDNVSMIYKEHQVIKRAHELEQVLLALIENKLK